MSGNVEVVTRLGTPDLQRFNALRPSATSRAIDRTVVDLRVLNSMPAVVPFLTGLLQSSFVVFVSPGQIVMQWSALDGTFDYAKIQDEGGLTGTGGVIRGKHFSTFMRRKARELLIKYLIQELRAIAP